MTVPHPWVATARVVRLGHRDALLAVLSAAGLRELRHRGHAAVATDCVPALAPSAVRFIDEAHAGALAGGKDADLAALSASPWPERPAVLSVDLTGITEAQLDIRVQPDLRCLRGHFPQLPVVPGAMLLAWVIGFAAEHLGTANAARTFQSVKFQRVTQPGQSLCLALRCDPDRRKLRFEYASAAGRHSSGRIRLDDNA